MEIWDIMNENGEITGKTAIRGRTCLKPGEYHLVVHIWIVSSKGDFLLQRRSESRRLMPGEWAATGGSAISGENSEVAAKRELYEELGIIGNDDNMRFMGRLKRRNSFLDVWFVRCDEKAEDLKLQKSEVAEAKWVSPSTLKKMIEQKKFHNYGREYFKAIFSYCDNVFQENI